MPVPKSQIIPLDYPMAKTSKWLIGAGALTLALTAAALLSSKESQTVLSAPVIVMDANTCPENAYNKLAPVFEKVSQARADQLWTDATYDCFQSYGLPNQLFQNIDTDRTGKARYLRELNPAG